MLDSSRLDAGVVSTDMRPVELNAVLRELNHVFSAPAEDKGLQLRLRASGLWVQSDAQLLLRLLSNLVDNAIKYTPTGGVIVSARDRGDEVWLDVVDTGIGIASEHSGLVFEEFYQVNNPGRDRAQGLGIGLSVVKRLLRLLGHELQVVSRPDRGTRFRLVLRAAPSPVPLEHKSPDTVAAVEEDALPRRVLVLDDEGDIRVAVAALLGVHGISVVCVSNAGQAEQAIQSATCTAEPFDVFVCDYRLAQGDDGLRLARHITERTELAMRVLLLTGETAAERLRSVQASGIQVLFKPVPASDLLRALRGTTTATRNHG
jgi:CheY-like chemotaxis protein